MNASPTYVGTLFRDVFHQSSFVDKLEFTEDW